MGIEAIGGIGRIASVAPAVGRGLGSIGRLGAPRLEGGFSVSKITNPLLGVSKSPSFIENRGSSLLNPLGIETIRNPFAAPRPRVRAADVIAEAEAIVRKAQTPSVIEPRSVEGYAPRYGTRVRTPEPMVVWPPKPVRGLDIRVITNPSQASKIEAGARVQQRVENKPVNRLIRRIYTPVLKEQLVEQIVEEKKVVKENEQSSRASRTKKEDQPQAKKSEKITALKVKLVEAVEVSKNRVRRLKEAYQKAKAEGLNAKWLRKFLGKAYWEQKSPIAEKDYDGTLDPTVKDLEAHGDEIKSDQEAENAFAQAVSNHIPVKAGEGGRLATVEEVREVLKGKEGEPLKVNTPAEIVVRRLVRKSEVLKGEQVVTAATEEKVESSETSLKDYPTLAEVFQKAA